MGKRGPKPQPTAKKQLRGNPGKRRLNKSEPKPAPIDGVPPPPDWLGEHGQRVWHKLLPQLQQTRVATQVDLELFALYCEAWDEYFAARAELEENDNKLTCVSEKGGVYQHPAVGVKNKAIARIAQLGARSGLSPSDQSGLSVPPPEDDDPFLKMLLARSTN